MKRHGETWRPLGRTTPPILVMGVCLWSTACGETPTAASHDPPAPQFKKGGGKPPPPNLQGTPLHLIISDRPGDLLRSDKANTEITKDCDYDGAVPDLNCYSSGEDSDGDGTADTFVLLFDSGGIEVRLDQGGGRRFLVGPFADVECGGTPCTGKGLIGAFTLWEDSDGDGVGDQKLEGRFLDERLTDPNSGPVTAEMTAAWEAGNYRWHLKYGQDCNYDAVIENRLMVTVLPGTAGWAVQTTGAAPKAFLCRIPQRGKRVADLAREFIAPVGLEFRYQNP